MQFGAKIVSLADRGVVSVTGMDARTWLDNLVTHDLDLLERQEAVFAGLLTPQGKILYEFFVARDPRAADRLFLDTQADQVVAVVKRLGMYKLRTKVEIVDRSSQLKVLARLGDDDGKSGAAVVRYRDPREDRLGWRLIMTAHEARPDSGDGTMEDYHAQRVTHCVAEAPHDYALGDAFPHEANWDRYGVSFSKGCFVGQEVVSRMQNKSVIRKRVIKVSAAAPLTAGADVVIGEAVIGRIGTVTGNEALAMLRLDRAAEAEDKGQQLSAAGIALTPDPAALAAYRDSAKNRPVIDL